MRRVCRMSRITSDCPVLLSPRQGGAIRKRLSTLDDMDILSLLLSWLLVLDFLCVAVAQEKGRTIISSGWIETLPAFHVVLELCTSLYQDYMEVAGRGRSSSKPYFASLRSVDSFCTNPPGSYDTHWLAAHVLYSTVSLFPAMVRQWWTSACDRSLSLATLRFMEFESAELLIKREIDIIQAATKASDWDGEDFTIRGSTVSREVSASYTKDDCSTEIVLRLPPGFPLKNVEVECRKRIGISESRWRHWVQQIVALLSNQDGSILDALLLWKRNVDKEFEGLEPCPICYSVLHPKSLSLPTMECQTCHNKFHNDCLYKWFQTSHKSKCPLCQQPFGI